MKKIMFAIVLSMFMLAACGSDEASKDVEEVAPAQTDVETETVDNDEEGVSVSGKLSFYTSQPEGDAAELVKAFNEVHPDVEVDVFRSGTEEVISKLLAEKQAGDIQADVLLVADAVTFETLKEQGMLLPYESAEHASIPSDFVDEEKMYTGTKVMATILAINTNDVTEAPSSWSVLTEDVAKGKSIMPSPLYSGAAAYNVGVLTRQADFGWDFYEKLRGNDASVVQGNGAVLQAVAGGEQSYGVVVDFIVARAKAEGSPIDLIYPEEGVPVITEPIGIMSNTANEPAAQAFVDFVLSEKGQQLAASLGYTPIREGIAAPEGLKGIDEMKVISHDVKELLETREEDKQKFVEIFGE
ncbi:ABC transporter substrate-binding protein [Alkalihalobacterium bogoriense]|uniref:ABC transporter substrate-binding protein n=1 Tax=Alkalihalobacterium bogoriense TaxID=246272 RepID=UPI00047C97E5|nr:ABC transporter substrate-binding protein [Alkalihalobacterium bogoriense]